MFTICVAILNYTHFFVIHAHFIPKCVCPYCAQCMPNVDPINDPMTMCARFWLASLYQRPDLVPYLRNDIDPSQLPEGSLGRSQRYRDKVTQNDVMNKDPYGRHAPLKFCCDGTPLFKDKNAGSCVFGLLTHAALDARLSKETSFTHLSTMLPSHEWTVDDNGVFQKLKKYVLLCTNWAYIVHDLLTFFNSCSTPKSPIRIYVCTERYRPIKRRSCHLSKNSAEVTATAIQFVIPHAVKTTFSATS